MKKAFVYAAFLLGSCACMGSTAAQNEPKIDPKQGVKVASNDETRCKKSVAQYTEALQFVHQSAGEQVGAKVMGNYISLEQLNQVVSTMGYCSGEQLLRDKKALR